MPDALQLHWQDPMRNFMSKSTLVKPKLTRTKIFQVLLSRVLVKLLGSV